MYILGIKLKRPTKNALIYSLLITTVVYLCASGFVALNLIKPLTVYEMTVITFISMIAESIGLDTNVHRVKALIATVLLCIMGLLSVNMFYNNINKNKISVPVQTYSSNISEVVKSPKKQENDPNPEEPPLYLKRSETLTLPAEETKTMNEQFISHMNPDNNGVDRTLNRYRN